MGIIGSVQYFTQAWVMTGESGSLGHVPLMLEHLATEEEYRKAAYYIRSVSR